MNSLDVFKTNAAAEVDGIWKGYPGTRAEFCIARMWNPAMVAGFREMRRAQPEGEEPLDPDAPEVAAKLLARFVLRSWRHVDIDGASEVPYTPELGERFMLDPNYHELLEFVRDEARKHDDYRWKEESDARGK